MRSDWNERAREDAHYYVAFGAREQDEDSFYDTGKEVIAGLEWELRHLGVAANPRARRALEIGCGPGRLVKPMSRNFGEIHGVDVADEMIKIARGRLRDVKNAHVHSGDGATLSQFADESFDFVYSYAVFQHVPSRDVVLEYCREAHRVMKPGAILRAQFNGLPVASGYDTWSGVRFTPEELIAFTREYDFQMLSLDGAGTQYMWTTWRKHTPGWRAALRAADRPAASKIRRITHAETTEPLAPARGRYAAISIWIHHLPIDADLFDLEVLVSGQAARLTYIGPPDNSGLQQVNAVLPQLESTGLLPVEVRWFGQAIAPVAFLRVIPPGPQVPRIISATDGVNLSAGTRIETGTFKVVMEEVEDPASFNGDLDGQPVVGIESFCTDPLPRRFEFNFHVPAGMAPGPRALNMTLGRRRFPPVHVEVV